MDLYVTKPIVPAQLYDALESAVPSVASSGAVTPRSPLSFDPAEALGRVSDDRELLAQMVELFRAEAPERLSAIRATSSR